MIARRLRTIAGRALDRAGLLDRLLWLRARLGRRGLAVLTYHRVGLVEDAGELDPGVFEATPEELSSQLTVVRAHCTVVSLADVRRSCSGRRLPPNPLLVTFDDGYRDGLDVACPILRKAGVPATFFVPTAYPDAGRLFWWDRVSLTMRRCRRDRVVIGYPSRFVLHPQASPVRAARLVCEAIKRAPNLDLARLWGELEHATLVALSAAEERALAARTVMGWAAVRRLRDAGMDVASHAHEHLVLNSLAPEAAQRDLASSARALRDALSIDPYAVAYPVGYALTGALREATRAAGFEIGFTNGIGRGAARPIDPLNMPRISMDPGLDRASYKARLLFGDGALARALWP